MTREQSKRIQEVERIIDYLSDVEADLAKSQNAQMVFELSRYCGGCTPCLDCFTEDVKAFNNGVHAYETAMLTQLKEKYLKLYSQL